MSGVAQLSWGDDGVGSRLSQLALAHNGEPELPERVKSGFNAPALLFTLAGYTF